MTFNDIFKSSFLENVTSISLLDMGIALVQEFHYRSFALNFALGLYPQRPSLGRSGDVSWNYQKAGLRYYLPVQTGLFVGIGMKANDFQESEYVEFTIGVRL